MIGARMRVVGPIALFEHDDTHACFDETLRGDRASGSRPDDQHIGNRFCDLGGHCLTRAGDLAPWESIDAWGTTPLYDAAAQALDAMAARSGRRALLLISDGGDRDSRTTAADLIARARQSHVLVYPVAIGGTRPPVFAELADVTGGRTFFIDDPKRLESQLRALARELRFQYLLGYTPSPRAGADPAWRAIEVSVSRPDVRVRAREGYFSR